MEDNVIEEIVPEELRPEEILIDKETMTKYTIDYDKEEKTAYIKQMKYNRFINGMLLEKPVIEKLVKLYKKNNKGDKKWEL